MTGFLAASLKLLIDLPCLLDFLNGLLKEPSNGFVESPVVVAVEEAEVEEAVGNLVGEEVT